MGRSAQRYFKWYRSAMQMYGVPLDALDTASRLHKPDPEH